MKKILIITSTVLALIIVILSLILVNVMNTYTKVPTKVKCSKSITVKGDTFKTEYVDEKHLKINKEQLITQTKTVSLIVFKDKKIYNEAKENSIKNKSDVEYDDKNLSFVRDSKYEYFKDDSGNIVYSWYKNYVKVLENDGYICK